MPVWVANGELVKGIAGIELTVLEAVDDDECVTDAVGVVVAAEVGESVWVADEFSVEVTV